MTKRATLSLLLGFLAGSAVFASSSPNSFDVSLDRITSALLQHNIRVSAGQVRLLTAVRATQANPELEITSVIPWQDASLKVRMRCRQQEVCLPFYVIVAWPPSADIRRVVHSGGAAATEIAVHQPAARERWLVRSGDRATLVMVGKHMRIELPVVCLSNGSVGHSVRVVSADHKQIYVAEVVGEKILKGGL